MSEQVSLTPRLTAVAEMASPCRVLADIGTDHAHLPLYMLQRGMCDAAIASDVNEGPLQRACLAVARYGEEHRITLIRSDGLHEIPEVYDVLTVAGMGGDLIARILYEHPPRCAERLILQPMTKPEVLRRFLLRHGYSVRRERAVCEGEKCYIIMEVCFGAVGVFSDEDFLLPQKLECTPDALQYLEKLLNSHQRRLLGLRRAEVSDAEAIASEEALSEELKRRWQIYSRRLYGETH